MAFRILFALLRAVRRSVVLLVIVGMIALNVATLTIASVEAFVSGALTAATGVKTVAGELRHAKTRLTGKATRLVSRVETVSRERTRMAHAERKSAATVVAMREANGRLAARLARARKQNSRLEKARLQVRQTHVGARSRLVVGATRKVLTMPFKTLPFVGAAFVATMTAYDLADTCEAFGEFRSLDDVRAGPHGAKSGDSQDEQGLAGFCLQNMARLGALRSTLAPVMARFDGMTEPAWTMATEIIALAEKSVSVLDRWLKPDEPQHDTGAPQVVTQGAPDP